MKLCGFDVGLDQPFFLIAGPCVVESEQLQMDVAGQLQRHHARAGHPLHLQEQLRQGQPHHRARSFRGPGMEQGLEILAKVRRELQVPVLTDVHDEAEIAAVAAVVDVLQTPAFLCRQTDFIRAVAQSGKPVNIKKGQFLAPGDMKNVIDKARAAAREKGLPEDNFMACERGASFGYNNLVTDMRSLAIMRETGAPVVFDATHSVQLPGGQGTQQRRPARVRAGAGARGGRRRRRRPVHGDPSGPGQGAERRPERGAAQAHEGAARTLLALDRVIKRQPLLENTSPLNHQR